MSRGVSRGASLVKHSTTKRVLRGGSWLYYSGRLRAAYRNWFDPASLYGRIGFRLVLVRRPK